MLCRVRKFRDERNRGRLGEEKGKRDWQRPREFCVFKHEEQPHLACSLSATVPAAVMRTVAAAVMMIVVVVVAVGRGAGGGDGDLQATIGSDLRAGNWNRGLAARASHTPRVLPGPAPSYEPTDVYTWDSWQAGDKRAPRSSTRTNFFTSGNRRIDGTARDTDAILVSLVTKGREIIGVVPFLSISPLFLGTFASFLPLCISKSSRYLLAWYVF